MFIRSFIRSFVHSFVHKIIHSFVLAFCACFIVVDNHPRRAPSSNISNDKEAKKQLVHIYVSRTGVHGHGSHGVVRLLLLPKEPVHAGLVLLDRLELLARLGGHQLLG